MFGELYTALEQGVVDGAENNAPSFVQTRHYEVCQYYTLDEHTRLPDILIIGTRSWNRLTAAQQQILQQAADESVAYQRELWLEAELADLKTAEDAGVTIIRPDKQPFRESVRPIWEEFRGSQDEQLAEIGVSAVISIRNNYGKGETFPFWVAVARFFGAIPAMLLVLIVIGGILLGWFTPTEASAVAVLYSFILAVIVYREVKIRDLPRILLQCGVTTSVVFMLIATSMAMSWVLASENVPQGISAGLLGLTDNGIVLLLLINAILLAVGTFMDMTPAVLIFTPILLPIVQRIGGQLWGVREDSGYALYFGIILIMNLCIGLCTPPVGTCLFLGCRIGGTTVSKVLRHLFPFLVAMVVGLLICTFLPQIALWLPARLGYIR